jgi:hypothetical protein
LEAKKYFTPRREMRVFAAFFIAFGCLWTLRFTLSTGNSPWFDEILAIDGHSHIKGMKSLVERDAIIDVEDLYHSPGYQIYLSWLRRIFASYDGFFLFAKLISWAMYVGITLLVIWIGAALVNVDVGLLAGTLLACSAKYNVYVNLLQGEVLQGFLFTLLAALFILISRLKKEIFRMSALLSASFIVAALVLLQVRFLPILLFLPLAILAIERNSRGRLKMSAALIAPALVILVLWSAHNSYRLGKSVVVSEGSEFRLRVAYNPNATGAAYPYPHVVEPAGLRFIRAQPGKTATLFLRRFQYLWDLKRDIWYLGNPILSQIHNRINPTECDIWIYTTSLLLFSFGLAITIYDVHKQKSFAIWGMPYAILAANLIGPMLVFASSRFLVPAVPMIAIFESVAITRLFSIVRRRFR